MQVNQDNYREVLVRHLEGELSTGEREVVESYIASHQEAAEEWRRLQRTRLQPDMKVAFPNKARLYRAEEQEEPAAVVRKLTPYPYLKYLSAIAAAIVFAAFYFVLKPGNQTDGLNGVAQQQEQHTGMPQDNKAGNTPTSQENKLAHEEGGSNTKTPPDRKKEDNKPKKQVPKKGGTIIIVKQPEYIPESQPMAKAEPMKAFDVKTITIPIEDKPLEMAVLLKPKTRIDFKPAVDEEQNEEEEYVSTLGRIYKFITRNISLRKEERDDESVYAFRLQTKNVSIYKTFRGL